VKGDVAMKKTVILVLSLMLIASLFLLLPSCGDTESLPVDPMAEYTPNYDGLTEKEIEIRKIADKAVTKEYGFTNLANYDISINKSSSYKKDAYHIVHYTFMLHGIRTNESYSVQIKDLEVLEVNGEYGEFVEYLSLVSKDDVDKAVDELIEKFDVKITKEECYFAIYDGKLTLECEKIVQTPDGDGNCGDHSHIIHKVVVYE